MIKRYEDFEIVITKHEEQVYANLGEAPSGYHLTGLVPITIPDDYITWTEARQGLKTEAELAQIGQQLFNSLIIDELSEKFYACRGETRQEGVGLRLRFSTQADLLTEIPLELLATHSYPTARFLALNQYTPIVRAPQHGEPTFKRPISRPLKILVVIANPNLQIPVDATTEKENLERALADHLNEKKLVINFLGTEGYPAADYDTLHYTLTKTPYDIVHFIGHGKSPDYYENDAEGFLIFVDPDTKLRQEVRASDLAHIMAANGIRIVFLQACEGGMGSNQNVFQGVAQRLISHGLPAVVAMQGEIDKDVASCFYNQLYHFWLNEGGLPLERAITEARLSIRRRFPEQTSAWWAPILFIRQKSTEILEVEFPQQIESATKPKKKPIHTIPHDKPKYHLEKITEKNILIVLLGYYENNPTEPKIKFKDFRGNFAENISIPNIFDKLSALKTKELIDYTIGSNGELEFVWLLEEGKGVVEKLNAGKTLSSTEISLSESNLPQLVEATEGRDLQKFSYETIILDDNAKVIRRKQCSFTQRTEILKSKRVIEMVAIPEGSFLMGTSNDHSYKNEQPLHKVKIDSFYMSKFLITQEQWEIIMGNNPSHFKGAKRPVEQISWDDAQEFCLRLSRLLEMTYDLPTEAEWEYACRAQIATIFAFGETITTELANYDGAYSGTTEVHKFLPNGFGLYDMHGNVWEWCGDNWHDNYFHAPLNGQIWQVDGATDKRVLRGGAWNCEKWELRCANRDRSPQSYKNNSIGFRVVVRESL